MAENKNGVWIDKDTGKVVRSQPARGRLLVAAGKEVTPNVQAMIDRYEDNYANFEQATAPVGETRAAATDEPKPAKKKAATRKAAAKRKSS